MGGEGSGRFPKLRLSAAQAAKARRLRAGGATWRAVAEALDFRSACPCKTLRAALERASRQPAVKSSPTFPRDAAPSSRAAAEREAERDPALSRRCAGCGRPNYVVWSHGDGFIPKAVGFVRRGGRWLCPDCAPRPRRQTYWLRTWGEAPDPYGPAR